MLATVVVARIQQVLLLLLLLVVEDVGVVRAVALVMLLRLVVRQLDVAAAGASGDCATVDCEVGASRVAVGVDVDRLGLARRPRRRRRSGSGRERRVGEVLTAVALLTPAALELSAW